MSRHRLWTLNVKSKEIGPGLITDYWQIPKPFGHDKDDTLPRSCEQGIGSNRRTDSNDFKQITAKGHIIIKFEHFAYANYSCILPAHALRTEHLGLPYFCGIPRHHIGKRAPAVNRNTPTTWHGHRHE